MTTKAELKKELSKLLIRNQEILKLKSDPKHMFITSESSRSKEFQKLDEEEQNNRKKIAELRILIRQRK